MNLALMTLTEAARRLNATVSPRTLRKAVSEGRLNATKIGAKVYVTEADLDAYIETCRMAADAPDRPLPRQSTEVFDSARAKQIVDKLKQSGRRRTVDPVLAAETLERLRTSSRSSSAKAKNKRRPV